MLGAEDGRTAAVGIAQFGPDLTVVARRGAAADNVREAQEGSRLLHWATAANRRHPPLMTVLLVCSTVFTFSCSGSGSPEAPSEIEEMTLILIGQGSDPTGDQIAREGLQNLPDLVAARVVVSGGNLFATILYAPTTFDRDTTRSSLFLDIDDDPATGFSGVFADGRFVPSTAGVEYAILARTPLEGADVRVIRLGRNAGEGTEIGSVPVTYLTDGHEFSVPLTLLENDDGRMTVRVRTYVRLAARTTAFVDALPDVNMPRLPVR